MALLKKRLAVFGVQAEVFSASASAKTTLVYHYLHVSYRGRGLNGEHPFLIGWNAYMVRRPFCIGEGYSFG